MGQTLLGDSIPNYLINGGFEENTPDRLDPVCWTFRGARATESLVLDTTSSCPNNIASVSAGEEQSNFWTRITQPQRYPGLRTYVRNVVNVTANPMEMFYDLHATRLASTLARDSGNLPVNFNYTAQTRSAYFNQYRGLPGRPGQVTNSGLDLVGKDVTYTVSYYVEAGAGRIEIFNEYVEEGLGVTNEFGPDPDDPTAGKIIVDNAIASNSWKRVGLSFRVPQPDGSQAFPLSASLIAADDYLSGFTVRLTRTSEESAFIVRITGVSMSHGSYTEPDGVPYNGDLSYLMDPRNIVRPSYGETGPPGFRPFTDVAGTDINLRFPSGIKTDPTPLQLDGQETHTHTVERIAGTRSKRRELGSGDSGALTAHNAEDHEVAEALSAPTSRSVTLNIKL